MPLERDGNAWHPEHADRRGVDQPSRAGERRLDIRYSLAAAGTELGNESASEPMSTVCVLVVDEQHVDAEVEERESDGAACATRADQEGRLADNGLAPDRVFEGTPEADAIGVVSGRASVAVDGDRIHRSDLTCFGRHLVEQRENGLLAGIGDVYAGKSCRAHRVEQALEASAGQNIEVHEMVVAVHARCRAGVLLQRR